MLRITILLNYQSAINLFLTSSITTTNTINELAKINADWTDLKKILHLDKRIGKYAYLKPDWVLVEVTLREIIQILLIIRLNLILIQI